ncbi:RNA pseudouridine synthase [Gammaproteobacteria bacterium SCGC AG-212-F23]|nr:RNA pseudouridine synthase [Gammaproteobacteria bacterium SCGC AG-212-F23]
MTEIFHQQVAIPESLAGMRLDQALTQLLPEFSRTQIQEWIKQNEVLLNEKAVRAKTIVASGDVITIHAKLKQHAKFEAQQIDLNIIFEDDALMIINKPAGMVVHPGAGNPNNTLLNALLHHAPSLEKLPRAGILHRLDKDTTGLLVIAKTAQALKHLSSQLKTKTLIRIYQTIVYHTMTAGGTVDAPLGRHSLQRKRMAVMDTGKPAVTHYRVLERYRAHTRLRVQLETGRTHQIRVHMAYIKHPVFGDPTYGGRLQLPKGASEELITTLRGFKRQALHAIELAFEHPVSGKMLHFDAALPEDMRNLIEHLRKDTHEHALHKT